MDILLLLGRCKIRLAIKGSTTMLRTVLKHALTSGLLAVAAVGHAAPVQHQEADVVVRLYKDFGWQAIVGSQGAFGPGIEAQSKPILQRYFAPSLVSLLLKEADCNRKTKEVCKLDFDPLFASQDPGASGLTVKGGAPGKVSVEFEYPSSRERIKIEYSMAKIGGRYRIANISYPTLEKASLLKILKPSNP